MATKKIIPLHSARIAPNGADLPRPLPAAIPLSLYVHVPWCVRKCPYCDFNSHTAPAEIPEAQFIDALILDLEAALPDIWGRPVGTVFIGGGTPSLLSVQAVDRLLAAVRARLPMDPWAEVTLEANPGTFEREKYAGFRAAGVNRLSIGVQSFDDAQLKTLGRVHDSANARRAIEDAAKHFERFNIDLMFGLPGQDAAALLADLDTALNYSPQHLSAYQLTIEPNTPFAARPPTQLPDDDLSADLHDSLETRLADAGLLAYETSAYARAGQACRHNLNYWNFGDYLGIGPGAHSKITRPDGVLRQMRWKSPRQYLEEVATGKPVHSEQRLGPDDLRFEYLMNALRLVDGFAISDFERSTGEPWLSVAGEVGSAAEDGLLEVAGLQVRPTARGRRLLNVLLQRFLP